MRIRYSLAIIAAAAAVPASAQRDLSNVEIKVERLAPGVAVLFGEGGNIGLSYGEDGNVLIDDQFAPLTDKILAAVATLDPDPVRFVVNTHWHADHTGGNENFGRRGATIMAHDNVRSRLSQGLESNRFGTIAPANAEALPVVTYDDGVTLHLNGDTMHIVHVASAHTDGDSLVHWQQANVLHMGDTFFHRATFPFIDLESGGSIDGLIAAADRGLALASADTKIIPGHGPMATRADLAAYRAMLVDVRAKVAAGIAAGQTLAQIQATRPAAAYAAPAGQISADGFIKPDGFVEAVYQSLRNPPKAAGAHSHGGVAHSH